MSSSFFVSRRILVAGLPVALGAAAYLWLDHSPGDPGRAPQSDRRTAPGGASATTDPVAPGAVAGAPNKNSGRTPTPPAAIAAAAPVSREMDMKVNPYAGGLRGPGTSKRDWDPAYLQTFRQAKTDDAVRFQLTNGVMAEGTVKILQFNEGQVSYVSGELTAPETGKFFFLTPPAGGKAGKAVGVVEFPESKTAYRVEPTGKDGNPELWQRRLDEVVCLDMQEADPAMVEAANKAAAESLAGGPEANGKRENLVPVRPDKVQDFIPSYNANIVSLQSFPGSQAVLLLDFAGGYTASWGGVNYSRAPIDNDAIRDIWKRIAEDYIPFNINVTTDIKVFQAAPAASRQRCCFGPNPVTSVGVAYFGSWNWGNDTVCWAGYYAGKPGAEVGAHEPGHTLGLAHQGQDIPNSSGGTDHNEYYAGQGSGETGWCPIMGAAYYQPVTTFAKGEYQYASQPQDELLTITTVNNNVAYRGDDTGATLATSRYLDVNPDNTVTAEGVIEQTGDTDAFQFTTTGGSVTLAAKPVAENDWANLGIMATLANSSDTVIATNNVQSLTSATITTTLAAGTYTFRVTGMGKNSALTDGFSNYASLGYYYITGSIAGARQPSRLSVAEHAANSTAVGTITANNPNSSPLVYTIASGNTGGTFSVSNTGAVTVANNALLDYYTLAANTGIYGARFELFVNITNTNNAAYNETNRRVLIDVQKLLAPTPIGLTAEVDTGSRIKLAWAGSVEATSYNVKRSTSHNGPYTTIATTNTANYSDTSASNGVSYYYVVSAVNANGESGNSSEATTRAQALAGLSFETPVIGGHAYNPPGGFWTFSGTGGNGSGILSNGSAFGNPNAPEGAQAAFVQGTGTITQTFSGFLAGTTYVVTYGAAQRSGSSQNGGETWNVTVDGSAIQTNTTPGGTAYAPYATTFVASAATHTIAFAGTNLNGGDNTVFIDNVQISVVAPTIANSSFETPGIGTGTTAYQYNPAGGSWTFTPVSGNNGSGVLGNGSGFTNANAPMGTQAGFVQGTGSISQSLSGFTVGRTYTIAYSAAQRPGNAQSWDVKIGSTVLQSNSGGGSAYASYVTTFVATATSQTLSFAGTNLAGGDNTVFIDNVSITSPPQPTAPAVILTGPANNSSYLTSASISLGATLTSNSNLINSVQFYADGVTVLSTSTTSPYSYSWTGGSPGWHTVFARVQFNNGSYADSQSVRIALLSPSQNLSFETPSTGNYQYSPTGGSWSFSGSGGSGAGILTNGSGFTNPNAPAGTQAAFLQGYGRISQTLGGFVAGNVYTITYSAAQRTSVQNGGETWDVTIDDRVIKSNTPGTGSYTSYTATFTATSTVHTLAFAGTDLAGNDNTVFLDNVSITSSLAPPTGLAASGGNAQAALTWTAATGATSYNVKRATTSGGPYTTVANVATASYTNTGLINSTPYYYVVSALSSAGESGNSAQASVTPLVSIPNPSFESPALAAAAFQYNPTGGSWTFNGVSPSGSGLVANGSGFSNPNAPSGTQAAFVQQTGTISQSLTGLNVGTTYTVTFAAAQRSGANQHGGESWAVKIDSTLVGSYNPGPAATSYVDYTATFTATAGTQVLSFVGTNLVTGDNTVFIDNVRIAVSTATLPSPWQKQDIGVTGAASSASYASSVYTINGAGTNVAGTADSVSSLYQPSSADCSVTARVVSLQNTNANAKAGVMVRESQNANSSKAGVWVTPGSGIVFTTRTSTGGTTTTTASTGKAAPYWVRIVRTGNSFAAYYSADGSTWMQLGTATTIAMASSATIGLGVESGDANQLNTATIDNVTAVP